MVLRDHYFCERTQRIQISIRENEQHGNLEWLQLRRTHDIRAKKREKERDVRLERVAIEMYATL